MLDRNSLNISHFSEILFNFNRIYEFKKNSYTKRRAVRGNLGPPPLASVLSNSSERVYDIDHKYT